MLHKNKVAHTIDVSTLVNVGGRQVVASRSNGHSAALRGLTHQLCVHLSFGE